MKNKPLKHYKRKKFFYRLFMLKSPRSGAMFGLAWMNMAAVLMSSVLFLILVFGNLISSESTFVGTSLRVLLCCLPLYTYGFLLCAHGLIRIFKSVCRKKTIYSSAGVLAAGLLPILGIALVPVMLCRKRFAGILFALAGTAFYVLSYFHYLNIILFVLAGTLCYLAALACLPDKRKLSLTFLIPFGIAVCSHLFLHGYSIMLQNNTAVLRQELSEIIGRPVEKEAFCQRESQGLPLDQEPLKSLIANNPKAEEEEFEYKNSLEAQNKLLAYQKKYPIFVKNLEQFLMLPVSGVSHPMPQDGNLYGLMMPELRTWRESARYLSMQMAANPDDKQLIFQSNANLIKLRNWTLKNPFLLSCILATSFEHIRFSALANLLDKGSLSRQEFIELINAPVDWSQHLRYSFGDEATVFQSFLEYLHNSDEGFEDYELQHFKGIKKYTPQFLSVHFLRDYRFALQTNKAACSVPENLSGMEKFKALKVDEDGIRKNFYILSAMCLPASGAAWMKVAQICDIRQMALLAVEVMEYRKQHGKLPDDLSFLPEIPLSKLDHKPLMYEKTGDGFRIFSYTKDGKIPNAKDTQYSYRVKSQDGQ